MSVDVSPRVGAAIAHRVLTDLAARLDLPLPDEARPGADLWVRALEGLPWPARPPLLATADGWIHPGPPTAWATFTDMVVSLGAPAPHAGAELPSLLTLTTDAVDAEAAAWMLPAVAVRSEAARAVPIPEPRPVDVTGATVVVLGTAWATPLVGLVLARLGARVVRVEHPGRTDPFPLHDRLVAGQDRLALDLGAGADRDRFAALLGGVDILIDGHPPRVLGNAGLDADALARTAPRLSTVRIAALADDDRPGYGPAAEAHGGWAARHDPPRLGRSSFADPVAGLVGALAAVEALGAPGAATHARVSLEGAVGVLLAAEAAVGGEARHA